MDKDELKGSQRAVFVCNGASGHSRSGDRADNDYYASDPVAGEWLLKLEPQLNNIWECAVGEGHLAEVFRKANKLGAVSDLVDRGYHPKKVPTKYDLDFLQFNKVWKGDIVTNPPYCKPDWAEHQLDLIEEGHYSALFMKITFLEGKERRKLFKDALTYGKSYGSISDERIKNYLLSKETNHSRAKLYKGYIFIHSKNSKQLYTMYELPEKFRGDK